MPDTRWTYPDGSSITEHEDGSVTVTEANGAKTHYDPATGDRTETPAPGAGGQPTTTHPNSNKTEGGEIKIRYPDGTRIYIRLNPRRIRIVRSLPLKPRKWEVEMPTGTRNVEENDGDPIVSTAPTTQTPQSISPSEHPAPTPPPPPAPVPPTPPGDFKPSTGGKKGKPRKKPRKPGPSKKPTKKRKPAKKKPRKKSRR